MQSQVLEAHLMAWSGIFSMQYNKTDYDDYDCFYLQKPGKFSAVSVGIKKKILGYF
ncbi:MAG: hypothetical protein CM15mP12_7180 [Gammaproteobacteria bacterium]|nr:MAG: hypothetical protein CM15mP12_7180 [Gammaproteobacteria bacterium]